MEWKPDVEYYCSVLERLVDSILCIECHEVLAQKYLRNIPLRKRRKKCENIAFQLDPVYNVFSKLAS